MENVQDFVQVRLAMYLLLARGFSYPTPVFFQTVENGSYETHLYQAAAALHLELDERQFTDACRIGCEDMMSEYLKAFELNMPRKSCSLYAGSYLPGTERGSVLLSVRQIYGQFGLVSRPEQEEPADFLVNELEFMQFLLAKESQAYDLQRDAKPYCWAQGDFLQFHLACWIPAFAKTVEDLVTCPFYRQLAAILDRFIHGEEIYVKERVQEIGLPPMQRSDQRSDAPPSQGT